MDLRRDMLFAHSATCFAGALIMILIGNLYEHDLPMKAFMAYAMYFYVLVFFARTVVGFLLWRHDRGDS